MGLPHALCQFRWSHGFGHVFQDLQHLEHVLAKGAELASEISQHRARHPNARVFIVAHSGGTGVAAHAAELLPPDSLERMVFLSSALSPHYDLSRALAWLNLGDAQLQAGEDAKAVAAYTTFAGLAPRHPRAAEIQAWIAAPGKAPKPVPPG